MQNKSAFLCGVMKTYRQREKQGSKVQDSNKGPDEAKIKVNSVLMLSLVISSNRMCSPSKVLFFFDFYFCPCAGVVRANRIHLGCHHRSKEIWRSSTRRGV